MTQRTTPLLLIGLLAVGCAQETIPSGRSTGARGEGIVDGPKADAPEGTTVYSVAFADTGRVPVLEEPVAGAAEVTALDGMATELVGTGNVLVDGGRTYVEIDLGDVLGWIDAAYLTEMVDPEVFCTSAEPWTTLEALTLAASEENADLFESLISPTHGLRLHLLDAEKATIVEGDPWEAFQAEFSWGPNLGTGEPVVGAFANISYGLPELTDVLSGAEDVRCNRLSQGAGAYSMAVPDPYHNLNFLTVSLRHDGAWLSWVVGYEYVEGQPYVAYLVRLGRDDN
ncbi:MAG: hypothetical protein KC416_07090 [Myxococcales bacterium]|nr:hypothetical protein [Myxococcales bacterium]